MNDSYQYYTKPSTWCMLIHQTKWVDQDYHDVRFCPYCEVYFDYPTKQKVFPVYKK